MSNSQLSDCLQKKDLNPKTCSFHTKCKPGYVRDSDFKCVKVSDINNEISKLEQRIMKMQETGIIKDRGRIKGFLILLRKRAPAEYHQKIDELIVLVDEKTSKEIKNENIKKIKKSVTMRKKDNARLTKLQEHWGNSVKRLQKLALNNLNPSNSNKGKTRKSKPENPKKSTNKKLLIERRKNTEKSLRSAGRGIVKFIETPIEAVAKTGMENRKQNPTTAVLNTIQSVIESVTPPARHASDSRNK
jgi:hypothetical protein